MASRYQKPPSAFLGGKEWGARDFLLVLAYQLYLDSKCPHCGQSKSVCHNDANRGLYEVESFSCYPQAAIQERTSAAGYKPEPGELLYARPIDPELVTGSGLVYHPAGHQPNGS